MKAVVLTAWTAALRSGKYVQGKGQLRREYEFPRGVPHVKHCCLGVLCELAVEAGVTTRNHVLSTYGVDYELGMLPAEVMEWAGMRHPEGATLDIIKDPVVDHNVSLLRLNDSYDYTFNMIADEIEYRQARDRI